MNPTKKKRPHTQRFPDTLGKFVVKESFELEFSVNVALFDLLITLPGAVILVLCMPLLLYIFLTELSLTASLIFLFMASVTILAVRVPLSLMGILFSIAKGKKVLKIHPGRVVLPDGSEFEFDTLEIARGQLISNTLLFYKKGASNRLYALLSPRSFRPAFGHLIVLGAFKKEIRDVVHNLETSE